jgi:hypothetical protein
MGSRIARHDDGEYLFFEDYDDQGFARGYIVGATGKRIPVPRIASLVYRGYGWTLTKQGQRTRLLPKED